MKARFLYIIIALLIVSNIISWVILWKKPAFKERVNMKIESRDMRRQNSDTAVERNRDEQNDNRGMRNIIKQLNLNDAQRKEFTKLKRRNFKSLSQSEKKINYFREKIMNDIINESDSSYVISSIDSIVYYRKRQEKNMYHHMQQMRNVCDNNQRQLLDSLSIEMVNHSKEEFKKRFRPEQEGEQPPPPMTLQD